VSTLLIRQPAGIGDIFFCQKIAKSFQLLTEYTEVIWPVVEQYSYLNDYMLGDINFVNENEIFPYRDVYMSGHIEIIKRDDLFYLPLQTSDAVVGSCKCHGNRIAHGHMKYEFAGVDYHDWIDFFNFKRNQEREDQLIERLGLNMSERYNVVNCNFGTYPVTKRREDMVPRNPYRNIEMTFMEGTTLFDWVKVLLGAEQIHTVETSLCYILAKLGLKENVYIYSKFPGMNDDFSYMRDSSPVEWNYIK
jgi:hypothetical protein